MQTLTFTVLAVLASGKLVQRSFSTLPEATNYARGYQDFSRRIIIYLYQDGEPDGILIDEWLAEDHTPA